MKILFISWDGPQVTYLEGLFLPIFKALGRHGIRFEVMQFTWASPDSIARTREAYEAAGIGYRSVRVHRLPKALGAVVTALWGGWLIRRAVMEHAIDAVMPRSVLPALVTLLAGRLGSLPIIFDADGLPVDERVEFAGESPSSLRQRVMRHVEARAVQRAMVVLTRTEHASRVLWRRGGSGVVASKFRVVGNGRDESTFHPFEPAARARMRARLGIPYNAPLLVYAGSIGKQYCPTEMLLLFRILLQRRPDARFLVLTRAVDVVMALAQELGIPSESMVLVSVQPHEVPEYLACGDLGIALRMPSFSMQAVAPIKVGEYLLCGLPVLASTVVGNSSVIDAGTGRLLERADQRSLEQSAEWLLDTVMMDREGFRARCNALGRTSFSLEECVGAYLRAIESLQLGSQAVPHSVIVGKGSACAD